MLVRDDISKGLERVPIEVRICADKEKSEGEGDDNSKVQVNSEMLQRLEFDVCDLIKRLAFD